MVRLSECAEHHYDTERAITASGLFQLRSRTNVKLFRCIPEALSDLRSV